MSNDFLDDLFKRTETQRAEVAAPAPIGGADPYALKALADECDTVANAHPGARNHTLNVAAFNLGQLVGGGYLPREQVEQYLTGAALSCGLDPGEVAATIRSGITGGMQQPRVVAAAVSQAPDLTPFEPGSLGFKPLLGPGSPVPEWSPEAQQAYQDAIYEQRLAAEVAAQKLRREARKRLDDAEHLARWHQPDSWPSLTAELREPEVEVQWAIDKMLPAGGNVLLTAAFKAGKTTLVNNLARAWADGVPFLDAYDVHPPDGQTIALFNYEVDVQQYRRWLRDVGITHTDKVVMLHLRGERLPLTVPAIEDWVVDWLRAHRVGMWVIDPFARAYTGQGDENDNSAVAVFLDTLDVIKGRAGVRDLILTTHTGRAQFEQGAERARGATRLDDWADVRWMLNKTKDGTGRVLSATGRDVEVDEGELEWEEAKRRLKHHAGRGRRQLQDEADAEAIAEAAREHPGILKGTLREELGWGPGRYEPAFKYAENHHLITVTQGSGNSKHVTAIGVSPISLESSESVQ